MACTWRTFARLNPVKPLRGEGPEQGGLIVGNTVCCAIQDCECGTRVVIQDVPCIGVPAPRVLPPGQDQGRDGKWLGQRGHRWRFGRVHPVEEPAISPLESRFQYRAERVQGLLSVPCLRGGPQLLILSQAGNKPWIGLHH